MGKEASCQRGRPWAQSRTLPDHPYCGTAAGVAELADVPGLGPGPREGVEVRVLSPAPCHTWSSRPTSSAVPPLRATSRPLQPGPPAGPAGRPTRFPCPTAAKACSRRSAAVAPHHGLRSPRPAGGRRVAPPRPPAPPTRHRRRRHTAVIEMSKAVRPSPRPPPAATRTPSTPTPPASVSFSSPPATRGPAGSSSAAAARPPPTVAGVPSPL